MKSNFEKLNRLSDNKLIDVVKNYKQYGYDNELRETAIEILNERGIDREQLKLTGNLENKSFDSAEEHFSRFKKISKFALISYLVLIFSSLIFPFFNIQSNNLGTLIFIITWVSFFVYIYFLIKSFIEQNRIYKLTNSNESTSDSVLMLAVSGFFYFVFYFYLLNRMKEQINLIR